MNVFDLDRALVSDYSRFARSFTQIRAPDIRSDDACPDRRQQYELRRPVPGLLVTRDQLQPL